MPRTQTSDPAPEVYDRTFLRFVATSFSSSPGPVYTNTRLGATAVVVSIDVVNITSDSGASILVWVQANTNGLFGGFTGAGQFDTFSWRGKVGLYYEDALGCLSAGGTWSIVASGYYVPTYLTV